MAPDSGAIVEADFDWLRVPYENAYAEIGTIGGGQVTWSYPVSECELFKVDADVLPYVSQLAWHTVRPSSASGSWPAWPNRDGRCAGECLHRWLLRTLKGDPPHGAYMHAQFINGDHRDCRIANLRWVPVQYYWGA